MKKITLFFLALFFSAASFGQFSFGPKIGYNASKLHTTMGSIKSSFNSGFHFGAFIRFGKKFYFQPEAYYTVQGGLFKNNSANAKINWKQRVTVGTLDIPVLVGFKLINLKIVNWRILLGPMASFVVSPKVSNLNNSVNGPITNSDINKVNWYLQAGTGVDVLFLTLDIRYQLGLNHVIKSAENYSLNATNNMWVVTLGFKL